MVSFKYLSTVLAVSAALVAANPVSDCVPDHVARDIVSSIQNFYTDINVHEAEKLLTKDFKVYSDSQEFTTPNITPVSGAIIYHNRTEFIKAQQASASPGAPNAFVTLDTFHSCDKIAFRWVAPGGFGGKNPIRGIDTLDLCKEGGVWKVKADYSEYDNVGFLQGIGVCKIC